MTRKLLSPLVLILLLALVLRLISITERTLWYDEAFSVLFAEKGLDAMLYGTLATDETGASEEHPLLYYTSLNIWMGFVGQSPFAVRFWGVLTGLGAVYLLFHIGRELFDQRTGLVAAFIMAIVPFHVQYSQEVRMYSLMSLLLMGTTFCFIKGWRSNEKSQWQWWAAFGILAGLAMHTQQLAAFYLIAIGLIPLVSRRWKKLPYLALGTGIALLVFLPWLVNIPSQLQKLNAAFWIPQPGIDKLFITVYVFSVGFAEIEPPASLIALLGSMIIFLFFLLQIPLYLRRKRRRNQSDGESLFITVWLFALPILLMWLVSQRQPLYLERALIGSAGMLYLGLGWLFAKSGMPRIFAVGLAVLGFLVTGIGLYMQYTYDEFPNSPFPDAITYIGANQQTDDVIVHSSKLTVLPMVYYGRDLDQRYLADPPNAPEDTLAPAAQEVLQLIADDCLAAASIGGERVWFVVFKRAEQQAPDTIAKQFAWLDANYSRSDTISFNDLNLYLYENPSPDKATTCE